MSFSSKSRAASGSAFQGETLREMNPCKDFIKRQAQAGRKQSRKGFCEHEEYLALREAQPAYVSGFVTFAYKTGWRLSEISSLTWNQVDMKQGIARLEVGETKNKEARTFYLDTELKKVFSEAFRGRRLDCLFVFRRKGEQIKSFKKAWKNACREVGLDGKLLHDFRRTAVRNMVRAGINERVAMMISGHKTRSVFDRYNIVSDADLKEAAKKQEAYLGS